MTTRTWLLVVPLVVASAGCKDKPSETTPVDTATAALTASAAPAKPAPSASAPAEPHKGPHGGRRHHGGMASMLLHGARDLADLKDPQKATLDKLDELANGMAPTHQALKDLHAELVDEVKAGKIDNAKLEPKYAALDKAAQDHQDKEADALNQLHAALDAGQRKALVAAIRAKQGEHDGEGKEHRGDGSEAKPEEWQKRRLERMTKELGLDDAQQKSVQAVLAKAPAPAAPAARHEEMKKKMDAVLTAFEADTFDAKKLDLAMGPGKKAREPVEREVSQLAQILPVLKPEQREKLVAVLERHGGGHHDATGPAPAPAEDDDPSFGTLWEEGTPAH